MCDKCRPQEHKKYWLHIADDWSEEDRREMLAYLTKIARPNPVRKESSTEDKKLA